MSISDPATRRRIILIVSVMALAFSAGHIMQNVLVRDIDLAVRGTAPDAEPRVRRAIEAPGLPVPPAATLTPFEAPEFKPNDRITDDPPLPELPLEDASAVPLGAPCRTSVDAVAGDFGVIWLEINAPCSAGEAVTVAQGDLIVDWTLDAKGRLSADVPALSAAAILEIRFVGGLDETISVDVPDVRTLSRAALVWEGPKILGLHALENGALYGDKDHVHAGAPGAAGSGGFLMALGDGSGASAEVYTSPRGDLSPGEVRVLAEAEVTSATCAQLSNATAIQSDAFGGVISRDVQLAMPSCDNLGDIVSLTTLFTGLRIASR